MALRHQGEPRLEALLRRPAGDVDAVQFDPPLGRNVSVQRHQQAALSGAVVADDRDDFLRRDDEIDGMHGDLAAVAHGESTGGQQRLHAVSANPR